MNDNITYERDVINSYLVIKADDSSHIQNYEIEMLERNSIDSFLELNIRTLNSEKKLYYNITSKQRLTEVLERKRLNANELKDFFSNLIKIIKDCEKYYLDSNKILLKPDMIYIDPNGFTPCYVYTPFDKSRNNILDEIKNIIEFFLDKVSQEDVGAVMLIHKLMTVCKQPNLNINAIDNIINDSISSNIHTDKEVQSEKNYIDNKNVSRSLEQDDSVISRLIEQNKQREKQENLNNQKSEIDNTKNIKKEDMTTQNRNIKNDKSKKKNKNIDNQGKSTGNKKYMQYIIIGGIQIITILLFLIMLKAGLLYSDITGEIKMDSLLACIGILIAVNLYSSKKAYDYMNSQEDNDKSINMNKKKIYNDPAVNSFNVKYEKPKESFKKPIVERKESVSKNNTVKSSPHDIEEEIIKKRVTTDYSTEDTVLLENYKQKLRVEAEPYLLNKDGDMVNKVIISSNPFIIGKLDSQVDYIIENSSVSRIHCKIVKEDEQYYIVDLNSKNGTYLDEERMVSNKKYPLYDGTQVAISNCEYTFEIN